MHIRRPQEYARMSYDCSAGVKKLWRRHDSFEHVQNNRFLSRRMTTTHGSSRVVAMASLMFHCCITVHRDFLKCGRSGRKSWYFTPYDHRAKCIARWTSTTSRLSGEYLLNESWNRRSEKGFGKYNGLPTSSEKFVNFGSQTA